MKQIIKILKAGKLLLAPTDTIWGILCDATNPSAVDKVYDLKKRPDSKAMKCMVADLKMLQKHIEYLPKKLFLLRLFCHFWPNSLKFMGFSQILG